MSRIVLALCVVVVTPSIVRADEAVSVDQVYLESARTAASRGDCETAAFLGEQLREVNPGYYEAAYLADPVIAGCGVVAAVPPPQAEQRMFRPPSSVVPASAFGAVDTGAPAKRTRSTYYGSMIAFDLAWLATGLSVMPDVDSEGAFWLYAGAWVVGPAIVHGAHGNAEQAGHSLLRRLLIPPAVAFGGALLGGSGGDEYGALGGFLLGGITGMAVAAIWDWARAYVDR